MHFSWALGFTGGVREQGTEQSTVSAPGYGALLTGHWGNLNNITSNAAPGKDPCSPSIFDTLAASGVEMHSYINWEKIHDYFKEDLNDTAKHWQHFDTDEAVVSAIKSAIDQDLPELPKTGGGAFIFGQIDEVDKIAHHVGFSTNYTE